MTDGRKSTAISAGTVSNLRNLRPWKPGQSGNPSGRPAVAEEARELARQHGPRALARLVELMESADERVALMAASALLDRAYGKPTTAADDETKGPINVVIRRFNDEPIENYPGVPRNDYDDAVRDGPGNRVGTGLMPHRLGSPEGSSDP